MDVWLNRIDTNYMFRFPVNPLEEIEITTNKSIYKYDIINVGEVEQFKPGEEMTEISFKTVLPSKYEAYCQYSDLSTPNAALAKLEELRDCEAPLRLIITDLDFDNYVYLVKLNPKIKAGESDDIYIDLTFHRYREPRIVVANTSVLKQYDNQTLTSGGLLDNRINYSGYGTYMQAGDLGIVTSNSINVRDYYTTDSNIIAYLEEGDVIQITKVMNNTWGAISFKGREGWVRLDMVKKVDVTQ